MDLKRNCQRRKKMKIDGKEFEVNNKDKVFYPDQGYTKEDVMNYYKKIAPYILPHLQKRPLTMVRYPDGIDGKKFYQKDAPDYFPEWIKTQAISKKEGGKVNYVIANDKATLVYLASQACISPHSWLSQLSALDKPDKLIVDLDPNDDDFSKVKAAAKKVRAYFEKELKFSSFVMTTGSRGLHVVLPIEPELDFEQVLQLAHKLADHLAQKHADILTAEIRKKERGNKIYLDVMRNARGQTSVAPYSLRARPGAPVATPLDWEELDRLKSAQAYTLTTLFNRLGQKDNPWKAWNKKAVSIKQLSKEFER